MIVQITSAGHEDRLGNSSPIHSPRVRVGFFIEPAELFVLLIDRSLRSYLRLVSLRAW